MLFRQETNSWLEKKVKKFFLFIKNEQMLCSFGFQKPG